MITSPKVGQHVQCNGYPGTITQVHIGQLEGMVDVRLDRGSVCIGLSDVGLKPMTNSTYKGAR